jgi:hypothetical protein
MDDLVAFLRARLNEDEERVRALAEPHEWHTGPGDDPDWEDESTVHMWPPEFHTPYEQDKHWRGLTASNPALAAHIARYDPARVLADIAAKRATLDACEAAQAGDDGYGAAALADTVICTMAAAYSAHPDYRPEWAPVS